MTLTDGFWDGQPAKVRRVRGEIAEPDEEAEAEWWHHYVREIVDAVEVNAGFGTIYIYDLNNEGWKLVNDQEASIDPTISQFPLVDVKDRIVHALGEECEHCHGTGIDYYGEPCRRLIG